MSELNTVLPGDTMRLIHTIKDDSVDLIVCDGPYGVTDNAWDNTKESIQSYNLKLIKLFAAKPTHRV